MPNQASLTDVVERVVLLWQRVLERPSVEPDDDFFELGGTPARAEELLAEINRLAGTEFPAVSIYHLNRPSAMAAAIARDPVIQRFAPPVLMRSGTRESPIFLAHGIGSNLLEYRELIGHMETKRPIYGIQSRGIYGIEEPHRRIEDMAHYHLGAIRKIQSHGPYTLIGYSLGGLIMLEAAITLICEGERIDLLVLIDSYPYRTYLGFSQQLSLFSQLAWRKIKKAFYSESHLSTRAESDGPRECPGTSANLRSRLKREKEDAYTALRAYQPRFYDGSAKFIRAAIPTRFPVNAEAVWRPYMKRIEVETLPGDHRGLLKTHFRSLAATLSRYLGD